MDYYVVTAVGEEEEKNISCNTTSDMGFQGYTISLDSNANYWNFTAHAVTHVNDSFIYVGNTTNDCCKIMPINLATFKTCLFQVYHFRIMLLL